ncbi:MAG TPA: ABC transporter permease [Bacilli bacterium]|nr:ABC transporter permease [Bacilli bacterium]
MKNKIKYLIKNCLNKKVKTKWFKITNILLLILIVGIINLNSIIKYFGGDFDNGSIIYISGDETNYDIVKSYLKSYLESASLNSYEIEYVTDPNTVKEDLTKNNNILITINSVDTTDIIYKVVSYEEIDALTYQVIQASLEDSKTIIYLGNSDLTTEEKAALISPANIERVYLSDEIDQYSETRETLGAVIVPLFIVPFFMLIVMLIQFIGADINEEKTTRGMEIIISSVPPKVHFFSKIVGSTLFVLLQGILFLGYFGIGLLVKKLIGGSYGVNTTETINNIIEVIRSYGVLDHIGIAIVVIVLLFLLSFLAYALLAGILASMTTSIEDYQQLQAPLMIICVIGYYIAIMASTFEGSIFIKGASYIPFISAMLSPILYLLGQVSIYDMLISLGALIIIVYLLFRYGLRVYKIGILNYSAKDLWKKVFKSIKEK